MDRRGGSLALFIIIFMLCSPAAFARDDPADASRDDEAAALAPEPARNDSSRLPVRITLFWENDGTIPRPWTEDDEHYTNGLKIDLAWRPEWAQRLAPHVPFHDHFPGDVSTAVGLSVSQLMFTPEDITREVPQENDRPYAGWLAASFYWQRAGEFSDRLAMFDHIELDLGVVGPASGAQALQELVHSTWPDQEEPEGWSHQLDNEFAANLTLRRKWRFSSGHSDDGFEFQAIPSLGGTVGTVYRQLEVSLTARLGWNLPDDFGPPRLADVGAATGDWNTRFGLYVFARGGMRAVQHNIFLDGNTFSSSLSQSKEPLVLEAQLGVAVLLWDHLELGWSQTLVTEEFRRQSGGDAYGALTISWRTRF